MTDGKPHVPFLIRSKPTYQNKVDIKQIEEYFIWFRCNKMYCRKSREILIWGFRWQANMNLTGEL